MTEIRTKLTYVKENGTINNTQCRQLLGSDLHHASYLLKKLKNEQKLMQKGQKRGTYYCLYEE